MKAIHALKIVLKDTIMSREREYLEEAIKELENYESDMDKYLDYTTNSRCSKSFNSNLNQIKQAYDITVEDIEKEKFVDKFTYTSCEDCVNKDKDVYLEVCGNCRHFYGCSFEKKEVL